MVKNEPEIIRAKAKLYVETCNRQVHEAPWTTGRTNTANGGGIFIALEMAEIAHRAHRLPYEGGLSKMWDYDPRRFRWVYDESGSAERCVKVLDTKTGRLADWGSFRG